MNKRLKLSFLFTLFTLMLLLVACGETINEETKFTVKFDLNNSSATGKPDNQSVLKGDYATMPDDPELEDYIFIGWFKEKGTINEFYFTEEINDNITLYAKWELDDVDLPEMLTFPDAYSRIMSYLEEATNSATEGINNYDEKNLSTLIVSYVNLNMNIGFDMITFAFTASFGSPDLTEEQMELAFSYFGGNPDYTILSNKYIMEYDQEDYETEEVIRCRYVVEYDPSTDSGKMQYYTDVNSNNEILESTFEFVKTSDGYAIQSTHGRYVFKIVNKEVVAYTFTYYEEAIPLVSIFKNPSIVNTNWANYNAKESISFDGTIYKVLQKEVDIYSGNKYRINAYQFQTDGTLINKTNGEWINIE